jgi:cell wall-associated NlpC family hydrolase
MTTAAQIVQEALSWKGTPYHHLAAVKGVGVDCAMLVVEVFRSTGLVPADLDPRPYVPDWHLHRGEEKFIGWLEQFADPVDIGQAGDVMVWRFGRTYSHGGILIDAQGGLIHAYKEARCAVLGNVAESMLAERPSLCWRVRGIEG